MNLNLYDEDRKWWAKFNENHWLSIQPLTNVDTVPELLPIFIRQNVHPMLELYHDDLVTDRLLSHDALARLLTPDNELKLLHFLFLALKFAGKKLCCTFAEQ